MARGGNWKWFDYYWNFCKELGAETYKTWRWELFASILVGVFVAFISGNWKDFRTAVLATGMALGCFVVWHTLRVPWLLHQSTQTLDSDRGALAGVFGVTTIAVVLIGGMVLGSVLWNARPLGTINVHLEPPRGPIVTVNRIGPPVKERCWIQSYALPPNASPTTGLNSSPGSVSQAIVFCNRKFDVPFSLIIEYDQDPIKLGWIIFPLGGMTDADEFAKGNTISAVFRAPIIRPYEPFILVARGTIDKAPRVKKITIKTASSAQHFEPQQ